MLNKNDKIIVTIEDMGADGEGIGKLDGYAIFIKDALIGDKVEAKIMKAKKSYAYAKLEKIIESSPFRIEPVCAVHKQCGGCQIQALHYQKQLEYKEKKVRGHLQRIGGFSQEQIEKIMEPIVGMEVPFRYRNKAQFPIGQDKDGKLIAGFYAGHSHTIISNTDCALGIEENRAILEIVLTFMERTKIRAYDEGSHSGLVRHVLIRKGFATGEIMVCLVINGTSLPYSEKLSEKLCQIPGMTGISININQDRTNVILGEITKTIWGVAAIRDTIQGISFMISPQSFYQVNPLQTEKLYSIALEYAALTGEETVWDLYCGIGTISLFLAQKAKKVCGVEIIPQAIKDAIQNAERNSIQNVSFYVGKVEEVLPKEYHQNGIYADVIVVDPPRKGCDQVCLETILAMQPKRIVYISCDSATLARDLKILSDGGYRLERGRAVDMFGNSVHVETVALLTRKAQ